MTPNIREPISLDSHNYYVLTNNRIVHTFRANTADDAIQHCRDNNWLSKPEGTNLLLSRAKILCELNHIEGPLLCMKKSPGGRYCGKDRDHIDNHAANIKSFTGMETWE